LEQILQKTDIKPNDFVKSEISSITEAFNVVNKMLIVFKSGGEIDINQMRELAVKCYDYISKISTLSVREAGVAAVCGNLALIFRRLNNPIITFELHRKSIDMYSKLNSTRDVLMEKLHLAIAYKAFSNEEAEYDTLKNALEESTNANVEDMQACLAGNLAGFYINKHKPRKDIFELFEIEENYFRKTRKYQDLAVSINNQLIYYFDVDQTVDHNLIKEKYYEFKSIVNEYRLSSFSNQIIRFAKHFEPYNMFPLGTEIILPINETSDRHNYLEELEYKIQKLTNKRKYREISELFELSLNSCMIDDARQIHALALCWYTGIRHDVPEEYIEKQGYSKNEIEDSWIRFQKKFRDLFLSKN